MATTCESMAVLHRSLREKSYTVALADSDSEIRACQRLRYQVFAQEMGAHLDTDVAGLDRDRYDPYCRHLLVRDSQTGAVVGTTRLLLERDAHAAGGFYSQSEFDLTRVLIMPGRFMEVGRTCIHPEYRHGAAIAVLWQGVAQMMVLHEADYLIGCASISLDAGGRHVPALMERLRTYHWTPECMRVFPHRPLPALDASGHAPVALPALLKAYLSLGAVVCGEPAWDSAFNVADVFVLMDRVRLDRRYARHFFGSA